MSVMEAEGLFPSLWMEEELREKLVLRSGDGLAPLYIPKEAESHGIAEPVENKNLFDDEVLCCLLVQQITTISTTR